MRAIRGLSSGAFRFALLVALVFAIGSAALLGVVAQAVDAYAADAVADAVASESALLIGEEREGGRAALIRAIDLHQRTMLEQHQRYLLLGADRRRLAGALPVATDHLGWSTISLAGFTHRTHQPKTRTLLARGVALADGAHLIVAADTSSLGKLRRRLLWFTGGVGTAIVVFALVGGLVVGSLFLRRLDRTNAAIERINGGALRERLPRIGMATEFDQLAANLNAMLARIERLVEGLRAVSVGIAHDLRTPLTRLRHRLEGGLEGGPVDLEEALAQIDEVLAIFAALLRIGSLESGAARTHIVRLRLRTLVNDVVEAFVPAAEDAGTPIAARIETDPIVEGDRELIVQALTNLVENALVHATGGSRMLVALRSADERAAIVVEDDGVGIPADERDAVVRRFYRLDRSRGTPGSGLGLALVSAIAELHGGGLTLEDAEPGLRATMTLPLAPAA